MTMKALAVSMILSLLTTGGAAAYAVQTQAPAEAAVQPTAVEQTVVCPNDGVPALDGTGYQGGRDENSNGANGGNGDVCINDECPNGGVPAQDGTGYQGGRNDEDGNGNGNGGNGGNGVCANGGVCVNENCPNDGVPARDGTGYRGGRGGK